MTLTGPIRPSEIAALMESEDGLVQFGHTSGSTITARRKGRHRKVHIHVEKPNGECWMWDRDVGKGWMKVSEKTKRRVG